MRTTEATKKTVNEIMGRADRELTALAEEIRTRRVIPACRRIGGSFSSGMGTFCFYDREGMPILEEDAARYKLEPIYETLNLEVYSGQYLGFWVRDVPA